MDTAARSEIKEALDALPGLNCSAYYRQSTKVGDAYIWFAGAQPSDNGFGFVYRWQARIALPQDNVAAEKWIEDNHDVIAAALEEVWIAGPVTPVALVFEDGAATNGIIYEGTR